MARDDVTPLTVVTPEQRVELAFLPLHKRAFGMAAGFVSAFIVFGMTLLHMWRANSQYPLNLLDRYFYGYEVSLRGAFIGMFWAGIAGFVMGWFFAFCRNLALAISKFIVRTRAELGEVRDFLDHI